MTFKIYKLRNKLTGAFHNGGNDPSWNERGKSYDSRAPLTQIIGYWKRSHLHYAEQNNSNYDWFVKRYLMPENVEIVEFIVTESECNIFQGTELVK
jgi:hypothetical protein